MSEGTAYMRWTKSLLTTMGFDFDQRLDVGVKREVPIMYEDNLGAIWAATNDLGFKKNKHMLIYKNYVKEGVDDELMVVIHCDGKFMPADMWTKAVSQRETERHIMTLGMEKIPD